MTWQAVQVVVTPDAVYMHHRHVERIGQETAEARAEAAGKPLRVFRRIYELPPAALAVLREEASS